MKKTAITFVVFFFLLFLVTGCSNETDGSSLHTDPGINGTTHDELTGKTVLTIASLSPHLLSPSVDEFNRTNGRISQ